VDGLTGLLKRGRLASHLEAIVIIIRLVSGPKKGERVAFRIPTAQDAFSLKRGRIQIGFNLITFLREGCDWVVESCTGKGEEAIVELALWTHLEDQVRHEYNNDPLRRLHGSPLDGWVVVYG